MNTQTVKTSNETRKYYKWKGIRLHDSREPLTIHIKEEDIKGAICSDHQKCVVAQAIKRQRSCPWVDVGASTVLIGTGEKSGVRYLLGKLARKQVRFFDTHDGRFAPCNVELRAPWSSKLLGHRAGSKARSGPNSGRSLRRRQPTR